jgi:hypothetical protein
MIHFEFTLFSKKFDKNSLLTKYSIDYLNDWLSYESEIKYLFFFGNNDEDDFSTSLSDSICILRHNTILNSDEKHFILSLYIEDAYVYNKNGQAILHLILKSEYLKQPINDKIIKYLCNHIYNQTEYGIIKNGIIQPLNEREKQTYGWVDEIEWTNGFLEKKLFDSGHLDFLILSDFTYLYQPSSLVKTMNKPIYMSNYNLECYRLSKLIDSLNNDISRYKKSIHFLEKKKKELKKNKKHLYIAYRNTYIDMLSNSGKCWSEEPLDEKTIVTSPRNYKSM